jgi:hypothetical protein
MCPEVWNGLPTRAVVDTAFSRARSTSLTVDEFEGGRRERRELRNAIRPTGFHHPRID